MNTFTVMGSFYRLNIDCEPGTKEKLEQILGPANDEWSRGWSLLISEDSHQFIHALPFFSGLIESNLYSLKELGIQMDSVSFWYLYEYNGQCNMEFGPDLTKKMGDLGITLCISCWEK